MSIPHLIASCQGKVRYPDEAFAREKIRNKALQPGYPPQGLTAYRCRHCKGWHLAKKKGQP